MTSLFMHASPALVVWALRWTRAPSELAASMVPAEAAKFSSATFAELVGCTMTMYSVWAVLYYFKVGCCASAARSPQPRVLVVTSLHSDSSTRFGMHRRSL